MSWVFPLPDARPLRISFFSHPPLPWHFLLLSSSLLPPSVYPFLNLTDPSCFLLLLFPFPIQQFCLVSSLLRPCSPYEWFTWTRNEWWRWLGSSIKQRHKNQIGFVTAFFPLQKISLVLMLRTTPLNKTAVSYFRLEIVNAIFNVITKQCVPYVLNVLSKSLLFDSAWEGMWHLGSSNKTILSHALKLCG